MQGQMHVHAPDMAYVALFSPIYSANLLCGT